MSGVYERNRRRNNISALTPEKMRVLHIVPAIFGEDGVVGGAERYALELAKHMAAEVPTVLAVFGDHARTEQVGDLLVHVLGPASYVRGQRCNPIALSLLPEILRADIVHCHQQHIVASSVASLACRLTGRKVFVSDLGGGGWDVSAYISTDSWYHGHLHISEYSRTVFGHAGKPWAHVISGGVDNQKFSPSELVQKEDSVLFVGRLLPHKGIDDLIKAITPDMRLKIVGRLSDTRYFDDLHALAEGKRVEFCTECSDDQVIEAYRRSTCIVLPSVYQTMYGEKHIVPELLGQTLLEGMACGTPGICTDVASMPHVIEDLVTGFVVPPNRPDILREKLVWMREHSAETSAMGRAARRRVLETFTWPAVVRRCLDIYNGNKASLQKQAPDGYTPHANSDPALSRAATARRISLTASSNTSDYAGFHRGATKFPRDLCLR